MSNLKLIGVTIAAASISTILYLTSRQSTQDKVLEHVFSLHANATSRRSLQQQGIELSFSPEWMGGGLEMGDGPWNEFELQLFSSTPNNPRQYTSGDTEFIHYKNVTEKDGYGATTFPPTESPTSLVLMLGGERPTPVPSSGYGGAWTREPASRFPTKLPETSFLDDDDDYEEDTRKPSKKPSRKPSKEPTQEPTNEPTKEPTNEPTRRPSKRPTKLPTREPTGEPTNEPTREPSPGPSKRPTKLPTRLPTKLPTREPTNEPTNEPTPDPSPKPSKKPSREPTNEPTEEPTQEPTPEPTHKPFNGLQQFPPQNEILTPPSPYPTERKSAEGSFFCGTSVYTAQRTCSIPCPKGHSDCPLGEFCYAVECDEMLPNIAAVVTESPTRRPSEAPQPGSDAQMLEGDDGFNTDDASAGVDDMFNVDDALSNIDDFYCGSDLENASSECSHACPSGSPSQCPSGLKCYASTGCSDANTPGVDGPSRSPTAHDASNKMYCGTSFMDASKQCLQPCPSGLSSDCPPDQACYANTPCGDKGGFFCGTSIVNASASCEFQCESGSDSECPGDMSCFYTETCKKIWEPSKPPTTLEIDDGSLFCGFDYEHASSQCTKPCPSGLSSDCPEEMSCYSQTPCAEKNTFFCGVSWNNAASSCKFPCPSGSSDECPPNTYCYAYTTCDETDSFMCGKTFEEATTNCDEPCPSGSSADCPNGMSCFTHTTCAARPSPSDGGDGSPDSSPASSPSDGSPDSSPASSPSEGSPDSSPASSPSDGSPDSSPASSPSDGSPDSSPASSPSNDDMEPNDAMFPSAAPVVEYIPGDSFFCGTSFLEASSQCTHPCPTRLDNECPDGEQCYGNTPCPTRDTYYCGANLEEASAVCQFPCPSGSSKDCPTGLSCFAFTTCADKDTFYCGNNYVEAGENCGSPCPSGLSSDCPDDLTCFAHTVCGINSNETDQIPVTPTGPSDSYFCGASFDDASRDCSLPCPSGSTKDCPIGMSCYSHTSCADRDSFMCGVSWEDAASKCNDPCPTGEHSTCPDGMKCFAYTPCNNRGSYFCGYSEDEASDCQYPCESGDSSTCPDPGMSCFSYTTCGTGDFNTNAPSPAPVEPQFQLSDSFYCGRSFEEASAECDYECPTGSSEQCPDGLSCFEFTTCVGKAVSTEDTFDETATFYCGVDLEDANNKCLKACPSGSSNDCDSGESCIPFTDCAQGTDDATPGADFTSTFFCGKTKAEADSSCENPCPTGFSEDCPPEMSCFAFSSCSALTPVDNVTPKEPVEPDAPVGGYCGTSFEHATDTCTKACSLDSQCPDGQSCYGYTSCDDRDTFYCGKTWDEASATCGKQCPSGKNEECDGDDVCFGYTPCSDKSTFFCGTSFDDASTSCTTPCSSTADCASGEACFPFTTCSSPETDMPIESFYCGSTFEQASMSCTTPCPSGKHADCPEDQLCYPYTPCAERDSYYCGLTWTDASTSCHKPCPTGASSECPDNEFCFPSTPCDESESFFCGETFEDATTTCGIPCPDGHSSSCPLHQGCFAYTLCNENGDNAIPTPTLAPIPEAPLDSYYCGVSYDDASTKCSVPCPSRTSMECDDGEACFASTPCAHKESFFCGNTWEEASSTCEQPCETNSDCEDGDICFGYTPCSKTETFFCGTSFDDASAKCSNPCPSGEDKECENGEKCFMYTPCPVESSDENDREIDENSYFCGSDFTDAASRCYLPCPSGSASECPVGEACYSTPCGGGDSFFCGSSWYEAASDCKIACPSGLDDDCPEDSKCFGYTPCSNTNSFYCGVDFYDASTSCLKPCPGGSSSECPQGLACFPNTPCESDSDDDDISSVAQATQMPSVSPITATTSSPSASPVTSGPSASPVRITVAPSPSPSLVMMMESVTGAPQISMFLYCGTDIDNVNCELPCGNGDECPLGYECYATDECKDSFFCGETFADANSTCAFPCEDGRDESCPSEMKCFAQTSCADRENKGDDKTPFDFGTFYCGRNFTDASTSCALACPSGSSAECAELGIEYSCFSNTPCEDTSSYYCGTSWNHASSNCLFPCDTSEDCPENTSCFPYTACNKNETFMCGTSFEDASTCTRPCPSGSTEECDFGESCFTHTTCAANEIDDNAESTTEPGSFYCGSTFDDASKMCAIPCPNGSSELCPENQACFANTPCQDKESFFCGVTWEDASESCSVPCETNDDCDVGGCFGYTACTEKDTFYCGASFDEASTQCNDPCPSGNDDQCKNGEQCFKYTSCADRVAVEFLSTQPTPSPILAMGITTDDDNTDNTDAPLESYFCGADFEEASSTCSIPCPTKTSAQCPLGQQCFAHTTCAGTEPSTYHCGKDLEDATSCNLKCPSGSSKDCPEGYSCFGYVACDVDVEFTTDDEEANVNVTFPTDDNTDNTDAPLESYFCGADFEEASSTCSIPCPTKTSAQCPLGQQCFAHTTCAGTEPSTYHCGKDLEDATSCNLKCPSGSSKDCPEGYSCFGYVACDVDVEFTTDDQNVNVEFETDGANAGLNDTDTDVNVEFETDDMDMSLDFDTDDASSDAAIDDANVDVNFDTDDARVDVNFETDKTDIDVSAESDESDVDVSFENTDVNVEIEENETSLTVEFEAVPTESYFCGTSYDDASESCAIPCPKKSDDDCPGNLKCFPFTPCAKPGSFFCGQTFDEASQSCTRPCPSGKSNTCPSGESCFAYTTCTPITNSPTMKPTFPPVTSLPTKSPSEKPTYAPSKAPATASPTRKPTPNPTKTPTRRPSAFPTAHPTPLPTRSPSSNPTASPTKNPTSVPTKSPIIPVVFEVPEDSFYCGVTFDHASQLCGVACPNGNDDCPPGMNCFGNTPCGERNSFFCGVSYGDANQKCTIPCPSGSANECPNGESCFAFTMCKPITDAPTEIPTEYPTRKPSNEPTRKPTNEPTVEPTPEPTVETEAPVAVSITIEESDEPTYAPTEQVVANSAQEESEEEKLEDKTDEPTPAPSVEETPAPTESEEEEEEKDAPKEEEEEEEAPKDEEEEDDESSALVIEIKPCDDPLAMTVNQAYWRSWSTDRPETCNRFEPSDIEDETYTHLVYSFASISAAGLVEPWVGSWDEVDKYKEFNKVKNHNPDVKTIIAVTEGIFYGAGMNPVTFREVAMTEESRIAFAQSVPAFLALYDFDGIEIDWDSPLDPDKGGDPDNYEKLPLLMQEIRNAIDESGEEYLLTFALPPTDWELLDFDVETLADFVDWFNLMTFDYHTPKNIPKTVGAHTDLKLIDYVVSDLVENTASTKFVLGMAAFGRTYTLADDRCKELGCPFRSPGLGGCGNTPGFLPYAEIAEFVDSGSTDELHQDVSSSSMVAVVNDDQLISYDDETTWAIKEAYAEMMCLRGVMLWSVDMLKAPSSDPQKRRMKATGERTLEDSHTVDADSIAASGDSLLGCSLCGGFKVLSGNRIDYAGSEVSCAEMNSMLNTVFIEQDSDQCTDIHSTYKNQCCAKAPSKPCDICGSGKVVLEDKEVHYSGEDSKCGKLSNSFLQTMEITSFTCSLARTSLRNLCCAESCQMCGAGEEMNDLALIELNGKQVTCQEYESSLKEAGQLNGSEQCSSMVSSFSDICCSSTQEESVEVQETKPTAGCNICHRDDVHHELKAEAMVEYKGASLSCVDVNSILAKNEKEGSEMCVATQATLFDGCCYEKCSLCGDREVKFDATVKYNKQILSCDEFNQLFSMGITNKGSEQCDAMQAAYSPTCCYKPPTNPCNLCKDGTNLYELNTHAFVKTRSGSHSSHCKALSTQLFQREDENSQQCLESKAEYFESCCNTQSVPLHQSPLNDRTPWNNWVADYMMAGDNSSGKSSRSCMWALFMTFLVELVFLII